MQDCIWITWELQRRSIELSKSLGVKCHILTFNGPYLLRSLVLALKTTLLLATARPRIVFVQNPSMIAAAVVCSLKGVFSYKVIVDRHSNFKFSTLESGEFKYKAFHGMSRYTIRKSDLTIVTNQHLKDIIESWGGRGIVLQDKIPDLPLKKRIQLKGKRNLVFISSFAEDEPVEEVIEAARKLDQDICVYITGSYKKSGLRILRNIPANVILTGYLPEDAFQSLLYSADVLMALTTAEFTLLCGAYEGVALHKPLIMSDKEALKSYFYKGVTVTKNERGELAQSILSAISDLDRLKGEMLELSSELENDWECKFRDLNNTIEKM